ncbi:MULTISPECIES: toxic anion resistance protein [unclassified Massilia]|uniref:toxic anion resistance protein n=1 Tax=unclassified Massilia TaxID=2609279 RepID=UPI001783BEAB|nr:MULTISPECIES: toxic anion resistance protein [unclassified Massilia]MBD8529585.1 toxic anion resistance protein [Massilia sp. CFBP 13647]MBD8673328.1 toxic anion resistance protein [Massilia sp. CFBP 13721]
MKPLFSSDEEAKATSAAPAPALPPLLDPVLNPAPVQGALPALRPEASVAPQVRVDISGIDDKAIESLGGNTGAGVAKVSAKLLGTVRASDADVFGTQLNELIATSKGLDPAKLRSGGLMSRVTNMFGSVKEKMLSQYQVVESRMDTLVAEMTRHANVHRARIHDFDEMYKGLEGYYQGLAADVQKGEAWAEKLRQAVAQQAAPTNAFEAQQATELKRRLERLEKRIDDLKRAMLMATQMVPQIRLSQDNARALTDTFTDIVNVSIPAWRNVFSLYLLQLEAKQSAAVANAAYDATDAAFRAQADMLLENTETVARAKQRSLVSLETAQHVQTQLITAFDKLEQISNEGQQRRKDELPKLQELERELITRFSPTMA